MRIARILAPITALGPGERAALWVQGCDLACTGCASQDTWDFSDGEAYEVGEVVAALDALIRRHALTGLTLSGGEPFQQADDVACVVEHLRARHPHLDMLAFTGFTGDVARRRGPGLWALLDAAVAGRYDPDRPRGGALIASANQRLHLLTGLGRERFADLAEGPDRPNARLQVVATDQELRVIGLPGPGDLDRLAAELADVGVVFSGGVSWQP